MSDLTGKPERSRVWIFGYTANREEIKNDVVDPSDGKFKKFFEAGGDDYVIVRADMVDEFTVDTFKCNVVIPVDAENEDALQKAKTILNEKLGIETHVDVKVIDHAPWPPHRAHGYITGNENEKLPDGDPGRQAHKSPGSNKWG